MQIRAERTLSIYSRSSPLNTATKRLGEILVVLRQAIRKNQLS
jgi:hypothetical protein